MHECTMCHTLPSSCLWPAHHSKSLQTCSNDISQSSSMKYMGHGYILTLVSGWSAVVLSKEKTYEKLCHTFDETNCISHENTYLAKAEVEHLTASKCASGVVTYPSKGSKST